jgi:hypothetical protein
MTLEVSPIKKLAAWALTTATSTQRVKVAELSGYADMQGDEEGT